MYYFLYYILQINKDNKYNITFIENKKYNRKNIFIIKLNLRDKKLRIYFFTCKLIQFSIHSQFLYC